MALLHIPIGDIDERRLQRLIEGKVPESREIDYKSALYGGRDSVDEWLADASSFANTAGGDLIFGMTEAKGVPTGFAPLSEDLDKITRDLQQSADTGLQPRLPPLRFKQVNLAAGGQVLVVRIPRSYNPPHRVVRDGPRRQRFFARQDGRRYELDVDGLRGLFTLSPQLTDRIRNFRAERIATIVAQDAPVALIDQTALIMHVVPYSAFDAGAVISLDRIEKNPVAFPPFGSKSAPHWNVNFDGLLMVSNAQERSPTQRAYTQLYRNGIVEAVASSLTTGEQAPDGLGRRLTTVDLEGTVLIQLVRYLKGLCDVGVEPPFAVMISLVGVKGVKIKVGLKAQWHFDDNPVLLDRDQFHFGEAILNTVPNSIQECGVMLRPFVEQLANMAGYASSASFGPRGEYIHLFG